MSELKKKRWNVFIQMLDELWFPKMTQEVLIKLLNKLFWKCCNNNDIKIQRFNLVKLTYTTDTDTRTPKICMDLDYFVFECVCKLEWEWYSSLIYFCNFFAFKCFSKDLSLTKVMVMKWSSLLGQEWIRNSANPLKLLDMSVSF